MPEFIDITEKEKEDYNRVVGHPLQSFEWGEFRKKTGVQVVRKGVVKDGEIIDGFTLTLHPIPHTSYTVGYLPKGRIPAKDLLSILSRIGKTYNCIFIKLEPNSEVSEFSEKDLKKLPFDLRIPYKGLFTKFTFELDLEPSEETLLKNMKSKTRYNIRLAKRKGVTIQEETSPKAFEEYLRLTFETTQRQKFYAHNEEYHKKMWEMLSSSGIAHLFTATYQKKTLVTWILFLFHDVLYYPYGASSEEHREVMASNLMMWETILWGKNHGAKKFDMWGALPPNPDPNDSRIGFHRFKEGYGARHVEFSGSFDLVLRPSLYTFYQLADRARWIILRFKK